MRRPPTHRQAGLTLCLLSLLTLTLVVNIALYRQQLLRGNAQRSISPPSQSLRTVPVRPRPTPPNNPPVAISLDTISESPHGRSITRPQAQILRASTLIASKERAVEQAKPKEFDYDTVLLIICSNRPEYLRRSLQKVIDYHPRRNYPIFISEDGFHPEVRSVIEEALRRWNATAPQIPLLHVHHKNHYLPAENGYFKLARHFKFALDALFHEHTSYGLRALVQRVLILEEDLEIAVDFFEYFSAVTPLLDADETLLCASAWNDNSLRGKVRDEKQLLRSVRHKFLNRTAVHHQVW